MSSTSINKRWSSIKSLVKDNKLTVAGRGPSPGKRFSIIARTQSPSPSPKITRRMSLFDGGFGIGMTPNSTPKFEIPKTVAEMKGNLEQHDRSSSAGRPNRKLKLLRLNTDQNLTKPNSAPSSPVLSQPIKVSNKRRLTIAPIAPEYSGGGPPVNRLGSYSPSRSSGGELSKTPSPRTRRTEGRGTLRRRSSLAPMISINVTGADDDDQPMNLDAIHVTFSPSENSMADPKYWDNPSPDQTLRLKPPQRDRLYNRRRSSALSNLSREFEMSRSTYSLCEKDLYDTSKEKILIDRRFSLAPQLAIAQVMMDRPKKSRSANRLEAKLIADMGELKISVQYIPEKSGLKVTVIKGENIGGRYKSDGNVNPIVSAMLLPGKLQKQTGKLIKGTKNPIFNDEFFFSDMDWELLETHMLRISVQNQQRFKNDDLGELLLPLMRLDPDVDNRMWKDLRKKCQNPTQECGYLQLRTRFNKQTKKLTLLIVKAQALLKSSLIGPPDTFVRVEVIQNDKNIGKKTTKVVKRTKDPLYREAFSFTLGVSLDDIKHTTVEVTVYAKLNLFGSTALGQVLLGYGSTEESEVRHWSLTMREYGREFTKWHALMPIENTREHN